jgi:exodeoxyribonuclease VIII
MNNIPKVGIYRDVPEEEYHNWEAVSKSQLVKFMANPGKFKRKIEKPRAKASQKRLDLGSVIDVLVFDGEDKYYEQFAIKPEFSGKGSREQKRLWEEENSHMIHITSEEEQNCIAAAKAVKENDLVKPYFETGMSQLSLVWTDEETGLLCKARPDLKPEGPIMCDLKSTGDVSYYVVQKLIHSLKYHWQAAFYMDGWEANTGEEIETWKWFFVEREAPYPVEVYSMESDTDSIELARSEIRTALRKYLKCKESGQWPISSGVERSITLPGYAWNQSIAEE